MPIIDMRAKEAMFVKNWAKRRQYFLEVSKKSVKGHKTNQSFDSTANIWTPVGG